MSRVLSFLLFLVFSSCASVRNYPSQGEVPLNIVFQEDSGIFSSRKLEVGIYFVDADCMAEYQGSVFQENQGTRTTQLPANRWIGYFVNFGKSNFWTGNAQSILVQKLFLFKTHPGDTYQLEATYADGMTGQQLFLTSGKKKIEIESMLEQCNRGKLK